MARVVWAESAINDLAEIGEFIAQDSPIFAEILTLAILEAGESLGASPHRGRVIPEINEPSSREIFYKSYRIMYDVVGDVVEITAIIHGARDFKP